uniref:Uncharacterized protein n=1 Tax=Esox lucius TaxID=8010 RepID=A0A3P8Z4C9_ESOLU
MFLYLLGLVIFYYLYRWFREIPRVPDRGNKYVYITGCDSGFGNLLARHLDQRGFSVIASCFTEKGEEDLRKACSDRLTTLHLDVRKNESIDKAAALIKDRVGTKVEKLMKEKLVKMFDPDLMKVVSCMEHAVAAVRPRNPLLPWVGRQLLLAAPCPTCRPCSPIGYCSKRPSYQPRLSTEADVLVVFTCL